MRPDPVLVARSRWARVAMLYLVLLGFSLLFIGPLAFALLSSLKDNPTEWPPRLDPPQLNPRNWVAAYRLGKAGGGSGWFGAFRPGAEVSLEVVYEVPEGRQPERPQVTVPRRVPGAGTGAVRTGPFAADVAVVEPPQELWRRPSPSGEGFEVAYLLRVRHGGGPDSPEIDRLPLDVQAPLYQRFVRATLTPNRLERLGRVASWNDLTSGLIPYVFYNFHRVFRENYSRSTGRNLFVTWIGNSFRFAAAKVVLTLLFASTAGYALARMRFVGREALFVALLFSMMVPAQVTFVSNYLVLRDGIFGFTRLFGVPTLLNTLPGLVLVGAGALVPASATFIMKQFFEGLPRELEEAARIDGAGPIATFWRVVLPLARPAIGALTILTFQGAWNEFFWALVVLTSPQDRYTLTVGLLSFRRAYGDVAFDWGPLLAGSVISAIPVVVLFVIFQRHFVEGISFSGVKG